MDRPLPRDPFVGDRVAQQNWSYMLNLTQHVLDQDAFWTSRAGPIEIQAALAYWLSAPVRRFLRQQNQRAASSNQQQEQLQIVDPLERAQALIDWLVHQFDHVAKTEQEKDDMAEAIQLVLMGTNRGASANQALSRIMVYYLHSLRGTRSSLEEGGHRQREEVLEHLQALLRASRVVPLMERLHRDNRFFPQIHPDASSCQAVLNLIGKRCKFMVFLQAQPHDHEPGKFSSRQRRGVSWSHPDTITAFGGCRSALDCVAVAQEYIQRMPTQQQVQPTVMHYSTLLAMMSYVSKIEQGMADPALQ